MASNDQGEAMPSLGPIRPPFVYQALVRVASWITPPHARAEWRARWDANLWGWWILFDRGELTSRDRTELLRYGVGSLKDALYLRVSRQSLRHTMRGAPLAALAGLASLLALASATHGFRGVRALFTPSPVADPDSLVWVRYRGAANEPQGVPPQWIPLWRSKTRLLSDMAGFYRPAATPRAYVTSNFFSVLGVRPVLGRFFSEGERDVAVLSGAVWRTMYDRDTGVLGRRVEIGGAPYAIVGVLPETFWALSRSIDIWTPLALDPPGPEVPFLIGALGRLKEGASEEAVRDELFQIARDARKFLPRRPLVDLFTGIPASPLKPYLFTMLFALACGAVLVARGAPLPWASGLYGWAFLIWKTLCAVLIPTLLWVELIGPLWKIPLPEPARWVVLVAFPSLAYICTCAWLIWWSFADQRRRCPVCLQPLSMPVTIGSWSSVLDPAQTETLCDSGHGMLCQPETTDGPQERWTNLDPSWRELFGPSDNEPRE
jgi:hypothetical protein